MVDAARAAFWSRGYSATSVDDLTAATGLGRGSLYGAFGDKHALFVRALQDYCGTAIDRVSAQLRQPGIPAIDRLVGHVRSVVEDVIADTDRRGCLMSKSAAELCGTDVDVDVIVATALRRWRADLIDCLVEAQADGAVSADVDPQALATMLLALIRGFEGGVSAGQLRAAGEQAIAVVTTG